MRLIERYIYKEYLKNTAYCLSAFMALFVITDLFSRLSKYLTADTPKFIVLKIYLFKLSVSLEYITPACLMLATLYTLWQLTRHNEIIAMRASGISLLSLIKPFFVVGICFSLCMIALKEYGTPYTTMWLKKMSLSRYDAEKFAENINKSLENLPYANTDENRLWTIGELSPKDPSQLKDVTVVKEAPDGRRLEKLSADKAEWLDGQWWFHNAVIQKFDENDNPTGKPFAPVPGENTVMEITEFRERPSDFISSARDPEFLSSFELLRFLETHKFLPESEKVRIKTDFHSRIAIPWACLIATIFAIPVGTKSSRQGVLVNIFMAIGYLFLFYATIQIGMILGKKQILSPWLGAWFSNIVFSVSGIFMMRKVI